MLVTTMGVAIKHDRVVKQSGELLFENEFHSSTFPVGRGLTHLDFFLLFKIRTTILDIGLEFNYSTLPKEISTTPIRTALALHKRFQLGQGKVKK